VGFGVGICIWSVPRSYKNSGELVRDAFFGPRRFDAAPMRLKSTSVHEVNAEKDEVRILGVFHGARDR
jgi:hypothetical protein